MYHIVFNPPKNEETASRLVEEPGGIEVNMHAKLILYHRFSRDLISCYTSITKSFNADQPLKDLFGQGQRIFLFRVVAVVKTFPNIGYLT